MRTTTIKTFGCAAAAAAAIAALPAAAGAGQAPAEIEQADFQATLSGSQVTTWETNDPRNPNDPCDSGSRSFGDQTIKFKVPGKFHLIVSKPSADEPDLFGSNGRPVFGTPRRIIYANATAERNGDFIPDPAPSSNCPGDNGGGVDTTNEPPKDCGTREGRFNPYLFFDSTDYTDDELLLPLGPFPKDKDHLKLGGRIYEWNKPGGGTSTNLDSTFENCDWTLGEAYQEREGKIFVSSKKIREAQLFNPRKRRFVISGSDVVERSGDKTTGKTIVAWNLRLKRVR